MKSLAGLSLPSLRSTTSPDKNYSFNLQGLRSDGLSDETAEVLENALNMKYEGEKIGGSYRSSNVSNSVDSGKSSKSRGESRNNPDRSKVMV